MKIKQAINRLIDYAIFTLIAVAIVGVLALLYFLDKVRFTF